MQITVPLTGKGKLLLVSGVAVFVLLTTLTVLFFGREPSLDEQRVAHLEALVKVLDAYHAQHGFYPQPAAREETIDGIRHVWGYRPETPSLASCTQSSCGGNVYDARGKVIGWKGTLAPTSALNSVEISVKGGGRLASPLSLLMQEVPLDPAFALHPSLVAEGLGEYIYAVRAPEDGAEGKGGVQYQLAATLSDPATGRLRTFIRGNYFVRSDEQDELPPSLIGPGILLDAYGNPIESAPLHVLLDGQQQGFPNPLLGEGESILRLLTLQSRGEKLREEVEKREAVLREFPQGAPSALHFSETLAELRGRIDAVLAELPEDITALEGKVSQVALDLESAFGIFLTEKAEEVKSTLHAELQDGESMRTILSGALLRIGTTEELVLLARDEIIEYLDGEGIEEQSRDRAGRRIETALDNLPDLAALFQGQGLTLPQLFLSEELQADLHALGMKVPAPTGSGAAVMEEPTPMITLVVAELSTLLFELRGILEGIQEDLSSPAASVEEVDEKLRRLARALGSERSRIEELFSRLADAEVSQNILEQYEALRTVPGQEAEAIRLAAKRSGEHGDFSPLLFSPSMLEKLTLEKQVGVPDLLGSTDPLEAEYKGIPYPLP